METKKVFAGDIGMDRLHITYSFIAHKSTLPVSIKESQGLLGKNGFKVFWMKIIIDLIKCISLNMKVHQSVCPVHIYFRV
jgi:hypothetical protein